MRERGFSLFVVVSPTPFRHVDGVETGGSTLHRTDAGQRVVVVVIVTTFRCDAFHESRPTSRPVPCRRPAHPPVQSEDGRRHLRRRRRRRRHHGVVLTERRVRASQRDGPRRVVMDRGGVYGPGDGGRVRPEPLNVPLGIPTTTRRRVVVFSFCTYSGRSRMHSRSRGGKVHATTPRRRQGRSSGFGRRRLVFHREGRRSVRGGERFGKGTLDDLKLLLSLAAIGSTGRTEFHGISVVVFVVVVVVLDVKVDRV